MSFRFKQFFIEDSRCAMKVGTDGVLLGCWTPTSNLKIEDWRLKILDVGTGSGLVALMLAQRCPEAEVEGIDIDEAAVEQARENFEQSVFSIQCSAFRSSLQEWQGGPYDLIVSNPPYFQNSLKNPDKGREMARHTDTLSYEELVHHSARLMKEGRQLALILPAEAEAEICAIAAKEGLSLTHLTRVFSKESKPARRVMMSFQHSAFSIQPIEDTLVLEDEKGGRSAAYSELCKEFYL